MTYLHKMTPGQRATVIGFTGDCKVCRRLLELGIVPGREVTYLRNAPLRDPMEVQIGACCLSLRHTEASMVTVELDE